MSHGPLLIAVHSPLVGPATWQPVAGLLRGRYDVVVDVMVPRLHGIAAGPGPYARRFAEQVAAQFRYDHRQKHDDRQDGRHYNSRNDEQDCHDDHHEIVLVGHSAAGAYLPAIAEALDGRVIGAAFVDAQLPRPGLSDFDASPPDFREALSAMAVDGMLPPWNRWFPPEVVLDLIPQARQRRAFLSELHPIALAYFEEPMPDTVLPSETQCLYLQLSEGYQAQADRAEALGWPTKRLAADHLSVFTDPGPVAEFLSEFVETLANR